MHEREIHNPWHDLLQQVTWMPTGRCHSVWPLALASSWQPLEWRGYWQRQWSAPPAASSSRNINCPASYGPCYGMSSLHGTKRYARGILESLIVSLRDTLYLKKNVCYWQEALFLLQGFQTNPYSLPLSIMLMFWVNQTSLPYNMQRI